MSIQTSQTDSMPANKTGRNVQANKRVVKQAKELHATIFTLYLAGVKSDIIAKQVAVHIETVRSVIRSGMKLIGDKSRDFLLNIVRTCFIKTVDGHQMIANEHTIQFIATQIARDKLKAGSSDRLALDQRLRLIGREITNTNKAFVDLLVRMGVPHPPDPDDKGSHRDSSPVIDFYNTIDLGDAQVQTVKTMERQLSYVRKLSKKADNEVKK